MKGCSLLAATKDGAHLILNMFGSPCGEFAKMLHTPQGVGHLSSLTWEANALSISSTCCGFKRSFFLTVTVLPSGSSDVTGRRVDTASNASRVLLVLQGPIVPVLCVAAV